MKRDEAEAYVYASYLRARPYISRDAPDARVRHPELTAPLLAELAAMPAAVVTGSKGKGSAARMAAALVGTTAPCGLLTSPHLSRFNERFVCAGREITDTELADAVEAVKPALDEAGAGLPDGVYVSPIGIQAAAALWWFARAGAERCILECGKGARFDDVAQVPHAWAAINTIVLEHTRELGPTLADIAADKACAIAPGMEAAFAGPQDPDVLRILERRAEEAGVALFRYGRDFAASRIRWDEPGIVFDLKLGERRFEDVRLPLLGAFQARNAALAAALAEAMLGRPLEEAEIRHALASVRMRGRMEVLDKDPLVLVDGCVCRASAEEALSALRNLHAHDVVFVLGIPEDKDYLGVAEAVADEAHEIVLSAAANPHYRFGEAQAARLEEAGIEAVYVEESASAIGRALASGRPVCILGIQAFVAEAEAYFESERGTWCR